VNNRPIEHFSPINLVTVHFCVVYYSKSLKNHFSDLHKGRKIFLNISTCFLWSKIIWKIQFISKNNITNAKVANIPRWLKCLSFEKKLGGLMLWNKSQDHGEKPRLHYH
jgi:hypothetical protein